MLHNSRIGIRLAVLLLLGAAAMLVHAHGDVNPHPVDTTGLAPLGAEWLPENPYRGNKLAIDIGREGYKHNCAGCHGLNAVSGGMAPDLLLLTKDCLGMGSVEKKNKCLKETDEYFKETVLNGRIRNGKAYMTAFKSVFTQEAVWSIKAFIEARTAEEMAAGK